MFTSNWKKKAQMSKISTKILDPRGLIASLQPPDTPHFLRFQNRCYVCLSFSVLLPPALTLSNWCWDRPQALLNFCMDWPSVYLCVYFVVSNILVRPGLDQHLLMFLENSLCDGLMCTLLICFSQQEYLSNRHMIGAEVAV